jgi:hypothetical protein
MDRTHGIQIVCVQITTAIYFWNILPGMHGIYPYQNQPLSPSENFRDIRVALF